VPFHRLAQSFSDFLGGWLRSGPGPLLRLTAFVLLAAFFVAQASIFWQSVIDDSYITFRFVDMFVKGHGWVFNHEGPRVEGFTNFLWAVALLVPHALGWDLMLVSKLLGVVCAIGTMGAAWGLASAIRGRDGWLNLIPPALLATNSHFGHWSMMGLETLMQVMFVVACYYRFEKERRNDALLPLSALYALLAALTRVDSLYYLSPLALYAIWLALLQRYPLRRLVLWALLTALPFGLYTGWRYVYFGSLAPNTYWAKQRHVLFDGRDRGKEQLYRFYLSQTGNNRQAPSRLPDSPALEKLDHFLQKVTIQHWPTLPWFNLWLLGLAGLVLFIGAGLWQRGGWLAAEGFGQGLCLLLLPWLLNVYYVYHVNGDWMPGYRFFQIVLPFIGVAFAVVCGGVLALLARFIATPLRWLGQGAVGVGAAWLVLGTAQEQLALSAVYIFGKDSFIYIPRQVGSLTPEGIRTNYSRGFAPPLREVSEYLLLNTQDGAKVFMSDIGQPFWFCEHLGVLDVDGLVDPWLSHSPAKRGDIPTLDEIEQQIRTERGLSADLSRRDRLDLRRAAKMREFDLFITRNANWVAEEKRPEYLLLFINHQSFDPRSPGGAYPRISDAVYRHPRFQDYTEQWNAPKVGNAFNHLFRRSDVATEIPNSVKLARLFRAVERNPRMPLLVVTLYRESTLMKDLPETDRERVRQMVSATIRRFPADSAANELMQISGSDPSFAIKIWEESLAEDPENASIRRALAAAYARGGRQREARDLYVTLLDGAHSGDIDLFYQAAWLSELLGEYETAADVTRRAIELLPNDQRAVSDYSALRLRAGRNPELPREKRRQLLRESLDGFRRYAVLLGSTPDYIQRDLDFITAELQLLESVEEPQPSDAEIIDSTRRADGATLVGEEGQPIADGEAVDGTEATGSVNDGNAVGSTSSINSGQVVEDEKTVDGTKAINGGEVIDEPESR
jgi:Flp pilus assembly protein TadD